MKFSQDKKWMEAKRAVGHLDWIEVVSYYHDIQGKDISVFAVINGEMLKIQAIIDNDTVLLTDSVGAEVEKDYDTVLSSRKVFKYS
ncbi:hypothetical protein Bp8pC_133 [Bacillus phage Bp8p-C]|uniref:Uncharacterized protein n=2 Tax=Agatevirus Bp8pC TaxID=1910937 RepID=A0A0A0PJA1_9CAUD|nr:portal protein [Bacillus phage Bp8p-C]YP_009784433.1 hypothetical protein QLX39_gp132 [Bacillus phage Bp8p-T]AHJ87563.1 hypothetical protein Bp8pC_133 [Bacillus phage Bp8p-C]AHJ87774.1 hypothetical protein Bp8pT_133 [Bacillus phage Bp8p-T]